MRSRLVRGQEGHYETNSFRILIDRLMDLYSLKRDVCASDMFTEFYNGDLDGEAWLRMKVLPEWEGRRNDVLRVKDNGMSVIILHFSAHSSSRLFYSLFCCSPSIIRAFGFLCYDW